MSDVPRMVRILATIGDNHDPRDWDHLLSPEQQDLLHRVCRARSAMDAHDRAAGVAPELPALSDGALEHLLASAGLDPVGRITAGPKHIDLIVKVAVEDGLLPRLVRPGLAVGQRVPDRQRP
ncbi:hypothetical protein KGQ19_26790 [Catenulispora sp. NL8]|uniref:Uncharacterized protein n=1 Tax=Catenulispora pinistramenti TaxID=2705254 RepID=A0ABS5KWQ1_9ACTN|nr:hypothetical protein [Catenulispora pinistramenti]MBS2550483.1 hypothetical protein [Catenulispora pinistramenti]